MTGLVPLGELPLSLPEAMVRKPSAFSNIWREAAVLRANQATLISMVQELAESALDVDSHHYCRVIERIRGGGYGDAIHLRTEEAYSSSTDSSATKGSVGTDSA